MRPVVISDFLPVGEFRQIRSEVTAHLNGKRVNIVGHKRGSTISYDRLRSELPGVVEFYHSLAPKVSELAGTAVVPTPPRDQSSCSVLIYDLPGDRIAPHFDHNFYNGRHFTVLLSIVNEHHLYPRVSSAKLLVRMAGTMVEVPTPRNTLVLFEGAETLHGVTALDDYEVRVILSMTFCTDPSTTRLKDLARRLKDVGYFGLDALRR